MIIVKFIIFYINVIISILEIQKYWIESLDKSLDSKF